MGVQHTDESGCSPPLLPCPGHVSFELTHEERPLQLSECGLHIAVNACIEEPLNRYECSNGRKEDKDDLSLKAAFEISIEVDKGIEHSNYREDESPPSQPQD